MAQPARGKLTRLTAPRVVLALPEGSPSDSLAQAFQRAGYVTHRVGSPQALTLALSYREPAAVLVDAEFLRKLGFRLLDAIRVSAPEAPVVVTTDAEDEQLRLHALVRGAQDCLVRPFSGQEAVLRVRRALERKDKAHELHRRNEETLALAENFKRDAVALHEQLRRNVLLLQRAVDFQRRLEPGTDPRSLRTAFLQHLGVSLSVDRLAYLARPHSGSSWLTCQAAWGLPDQLAERIRIQSEGELASLLHSTASAAVVERLSRVPGLRLELGILAAGGFTAVLPLLVRSELWGVILLGEGKEGGTPDGETLRLGQFLSSAMVPLFVAQTLLGQEREASSRTIARLVSRLEAADPYFRGHSERVARLAERIGMHLGLTEEDLAALVTAGWLHDMGRLESRESFWSKPGPLTAEGWERVRRYPEETAQLLDEADWPERIRLAVRHHHEHWDGSGYPLGLKESAIPLDARILAVADALEALTRPRPYRPARSRAEAVRTLREEAGAKFDPALVEAVVDQSQIRA